MYRRVSLLLSLLVLSLAPTAAHAATNCDPGADWGTLDAPAAAKVLSLVNQYRASKGLSQLGTDPSLTAAAEWKSLHMAKYQYLDHPDPAPPVARSPFDRLRDCGFVASGPEGENIAVGQRTPEEVMAAWIDSPGHRQNIENPNYTVIGIATAIDSKGRFWWSQDFGAGAGKAVDRATPLGPPPPPSTPAPSTTPTVPPVIVRSGGRAKVRAHRGEPTKLDLGEIDSFDAPLTLHARLATDGTGLVIAPGRHAHHWMSLHFTARAHDGTLSETVLLVIVERARHRRHRR